MLFTQTFLDGIRRGEVTLAFRRWTRPTVRSAGRLRTPVGELEIRAVVPVQKSSITAAEARLAGYATLDGLLRDLDARPRGTVYRIELGALREDPRAALRARAAAGDDARRLLERVRRLDARSRTGPWTHRTLDVVRQWPGVRAADLCRRVGQDRETFKANVRKLKNLGLTESLPVGYRLSARGDALLRGALVRDAPPVQAGSGRRGRR